MRIALRLVAATLAIPLLSCGPKKVAPQSLSPADINSTEYTLRWAYVAFHHPHRRLSDLGMYLYERTWALPSFPADKAGAQAALQPYLADYQIKVEQVGQALIQDGHASCSLNGIQSGSSASKANYTCLGHAAVLQVATRLREPNKGEICVNVDCQQLLRIDAPGAVLPYQLLTSAGWVKGFVPNHSFNICTDEGGQECTYAWLACYVRSPKTTP